MTKVLGLSEFLTTQTCWHRLLSLIISEFAKAENVKKNRLMSSLMTPKFFFVFEQDGISFGVSRIPVIIVIGLHKGWIRLISRVYYFIASPIIKETFWLIHARILGRKEVLFMLIVIVMKSATERGRRAARGLFLSEYAREFVFQAVLKTIKRIIKIDSPSWSSI